MKRITLNDAIGMLEGWKNNKWKRTAYESLEKNTFDKDSKRVTITRDLEIKVSDAKRASTYSELEARLNGVKHEYDYFNTTNHKKYANSEISKFDRELIKQRFEEAKSDLEFLEEKLDKLGENIFIEL